MRIALLSGAVPKTCNDGPTVRLLAGTWRFHLQGLVDSILGLKVEGQPYTLVPNQHTLKVEIPAPVQLVFVTRGTEPYITAFAERI